MSVSAAQQILKSAGLYAGKIDGVIGRQSLDAAERVRASADLNWTGWTDRRRVIGALQHLLNTTGHEAGHVDGYAGHNTQNAFDAWQAAQEGRPASPERTPLQSDMVKVYGAAGSAAATAGRVVLPFAHVIAWNTEQRINQFSCHSIVADRLTRIFKDAAQHYGEAEYRKLRLDLYGGCFNNRNMRGGQTKSTHAFGVAVDLDPERNQLRWGRDRASFAAPAYEPFWKIVEASGAVSLGRIRNFDWMHFQFARV